MISPALRPWVDGVDQLAEVDHVLALARILDRLVPPRPADQAQRTGVPDGLGGFGRRGPIERLVPSAWALAELAPMEFLRRYTQQELLFGELQHRQPAEGRRVVLAFDVGPRQLGAPRLGQLALWVALATRAQRAGDELVPVLLQQPEQLLPSGLKRGGLRGWSASRSRVPVDGRGAQRAVQRCGPWRPGDRLWWISPTPVPTEVRTQVEERGGSVSTARFDDELCDGVRRVRARLADRGRRAEVLLPPIDEVAAASILRDPLARRQLPRAVGDPWFEQLLWPASGRRLMARAGNGQWVAIAIPKDRCHTVLSLRHAPRLSVPVVAVGWARGHVLSVGYADGRWVISGKDPLIVPGPMPPPGVGTVVSRRGPVGTWMCIGGALFHLVDDDGAPRIESYGSGSMLAQSSSLWLLRRQGRRLVRTTVNAAGSSPIPHPVDARGTGVILDDGGIAVVDGRQLRDAGSWRFEVPDGHELVGLAAPLGRHRVVTRSEGSLWMHATNGLAQVELGSVDGPAVLGPQGWVAWIHGEQLHVRDISEWQVRARVNAPARLR